ncbi:MULTISPECIES: pyrroloquinoline quinone biosynthesis peptide chaperone PqqD [Methyloversatilis]|jgi:pyrroloquinoline quinone biosynthesis protein D|uniref:pyrroloquinoline quinone biosynthesis peptide chaperone PqqD n=1 Tax=Methyloversatilis TaxID=378210 RepID=UPI0003816684|nr:MULTISPECIES: pyrroloquinoline quinone biosynthesis peptide chaperone PqqD [Methyloversatilis]MBV5284925.1 pyrroloquinoline quinone biosynthesis peptide chaperone PqqD [Methyloversatilis discipulorum]MCR6666469.1 pyrroloquinoline quinone biosynthesis peptide chaperone PqqD [Methyloversatilis sp.]MDY0056274.1 pyrroloquinoline quinone biosynthesis peptide chaperone PqqD [Methyloversatilis sp.]PZU51630.1 MAG: pyrroloquinoline quinone biosynthesis peptide chaperone PqqD [Thauera sp.]
MTVTTASVPKIGRHFRIQWEEAQKAYVLLYPEGMVKLNQSAGEILKRCSGEASVADITADLEKTFNAQGLQQDVINFVELALQQKWVETT